MKQKGEIKNGVLSIDKASLTKWVRSQKDCEIEMTLKILGKNRSLNQNALYWKRNKILADHIGYPDVYEQHLDTMERAGFGEHKNINGKNIFIRKSSATLNVQDFNKLIEEQSKIAIFLEVELPCD